MKCDRAEANRRAALEAVCADKECHSGEIINKQLFKKDMFTSCF